MEAFGDRMEGVGALNPSSGAEATFIERESEVRGSQTAGKTQRYYSRFVGRGDRDGTDGSD